MTDALPVPGLACRKALMNKLLGVKLVILACLGLLLAACSSAPPPAAANQAFSQVAYTMGPGDKLRVVVFRHEDLSGDFTLDGAGKFAMPLIGEVDALGLTSSELEKRIEKKYANGYLVEPQVSIQVENYRPFYILGEVNKPGQYEYVNGMTMLNAVALAGGFTYRAAQDSVTVKRGGANAKPVTVSADTPILPGDIIEVPERFF
jgi:polysaccharide export outer membrane protein